MKIYLSNTNQKKAGVAIIISGKVSFGGRIITRNEKRDTYNVKWVHSPRRHNSKCVST